jgi:hypothetical protein
MTKAQLNDAARKSLGVGCMFLETEGVQALPREKQSLLREMLEKFNQFTPDNDPYGEHDFGSIELDGEKYFWKIDDYGENHIESGATHRRVLTLMRADEY